MDGSRITSRINTVRLKHTLMQEICNYSAEFLIQSTLATFRHAPANDTHCDSHFERLIFPSNE